MRGLSGYILAIVVMACCSCSNDLETINKVTSRSTLPVETGKNVFINYTDSGLPRARVFAKVLERYATEDKNYAEMKQGIIAYFFNRKQQVDSYLKSKYAIHYEREKKMIVRNDVILVNNQGDTLSTEELQWDQSTQGIRTDKFVRITTPNEIIMGDGLESNTEFTRYKILKPRGTITLER